MSFETLLIISRDKQRYVEQVPPVKVSPVTFMSGSFFFRQHDKFSVIVLGTPMIIKNDMCMIYSIVQVWFGSFSTNIKLIFFKRRRKP